MRLEVRVFSGLEKFVDGVTFGQAFEMELPEGANGRDLLELLGIPENQVFSILANGKHFSLGDKFGPGDRVALFPPVGGG
ncbi:thiamineS protein [Desulfocucumis palustris]|uniref:ThiamineS protein n=1 Tax=Desulfocucumis palustris TaxID=1898651 RepID=A0A2L2XFM7_9FIRM|nr:MoaD/ThiS family protein [Desulfocucumis palustris]GBF35149.1 thiamineS protein [Desulfocucumis palustris]